MRLQLFLSDYSHKTKWQDAPQPSSHISTTFIRSSWCTQPHFTSRYSLQFLRHVTRNKYMLLSCTKKSCSIAGSNRVDQEPTHHHHTIHQRRRSTTMRTVLTNWRQVTAPRCQGTAGHNTKARNRPTLQCRGERRGRWKGRSERHRNTHEESSCVQSSCQSGPPFPMGQMEDTEAKPMPQDPYLWL